MKYQVGDLVELSYKYGVSCCLEEYEIVANRGDFYNVRVLCDAKSHGRTLVSEREISGESFDSWVRRVRVEHGLTA